MNLGDINQASRDHKPEPELAGGVWPVMITPFLPDRSIDWQGLDRLVDWYAEAGAAGLFAVCLSSEMFELEQTERLALAARIVQRVEGRLPVVASGTFGRTRGERATGVRRMADQGVTAVVALVSVMATEAEDEDAWQANARDLLHDTSDIALGLYECPLPYHRLLPASTVAWAASTGRFLFLKETSGQLPLVAEKLDVIRGTSLRLYNASAENLLQSIRMGANGFCGISANFVPELWAWLCCHAHGEPETAKRLQGFLRDAETVFTTGYPASAKQFMSMRGLPIGPTCRVRGSSLAGPEVSRLTEVGDQANAWRRELGI